MPHTSSAPALFTDAFLRKLAVPKGRKDIVFRAPQRPRRAQASRDRRHLVPDPAAAPRWPTLARDPAPASSAPEPRRRPPRVTGSPGDIAVGLDPFAERAEATAELEAKREAETAAKAKVKPTSSHSDTDAARDHHALAHRREVRRRALRTIELTFPALIDKPVAEIERKMVRAAVDAALDTRGPAAAIMAASAMRTMYRWAKKKRSRRHRHHAQLCAAVRRTGARAYLERGRDSARVPALLE